jgi:hypothetical protein
MGVPMTSAIGDCVKELGRRKRMEKVLDSNEILFKIIGNRLHKSVRRSPGTA